MSGDGASTNGSDRRTQASEPMVVRIATNGESRAVVSRTTAHEAPGLLHLAVSLQVVDANSGRWLLQRRAAAKTLFPDLWANTCCTHPAPGEDPARAALRRVREETGLVLDDLIAAGSFTYRATDDVSGLIEHEHDHVFVALVDTRGAKPDPKEVSELALLAYADALALVRSDAGAPWAADVLTRSRAALDRRGLPSSGGPGRSGQAAPRRSSRSVAGTGIVSSPPQRGTRTVGLGPDDQLL